MKPYIVCVFVLSSTLVGGACSSDEPATGARDTNASVTGDAVFGNGDSAEPADTVAPPQDVGAEGPDSAFTDAETSPSDGSAAPDVADDSTVPDAGVDAPLTDGSDALSDSDGTTPSLPDGGDTNDQGDSPVEAAADALDPVCESGATQCIDGVVNVCNDEGSAFVASETCQDTEICILGACESLCAEAAKKYLSEGCEFIAVSTVNAYLTTAMLSDFAVVVTNPIQNPSATVEVTQAGAVVGEAMVPPGGTHVFSLTMTSEVAEAEGAVLAPQAAFIVTSDVPVAAYQFNPLNFEDVVNETFSFSNDASLLLPTHTLGTDYRAMSWPTWGEFIAWTSGFVAIAAVEDGTTVTFTASSPTMPGDIAALSAGEAVSVTLNRGDVLQFVGEKYNEPFAYINAQTCSQPGWEFDGNMSCQAVDIDLTGSSIEASAPVAVFSGHDCLRVPYNKEKCDHVEEQLLARTSWDKAFYLAAPQRPDSAATAKAQYRVLALEDDTVVNVSPDVAGPFTLSEGQVATFTTDADVAIQGNKDFAVMQALLSSGALEPPALDDDGIPLCDPAAAIGVPQRQARPAYVFQAPNTYQSHWINVVRLAGDPIALDDVAVTGFTPIENSPYEAARVPVEPGAHRIESMTQAPFTIMVYGYAPHTSYMYPGGLRVLP